MLTRLRLHQFRYPFRFQLGCLLLSVVAALMFPPRAFADSSPFSNLEEIANALNVSAYHNTVGAKKVKVAILDNGFRGSHAAIGSTLPATTVSHAGPVPVNPDTEEAHGLFMAQLVAGLLRHAPGIEYEMHLFSTFGYSNLKAAIESVVAQKFDVVLYAQVWEYGGNGDGRGFINSLIHTATQAGVLWVNAAGNYGDATYRAPIQTSADGWARLPGPNDSVRVRCMERPNSPDSKCSLRVVLSWNDFKDDVSKGTDKDLDLVLTDDTLRIIQTSGLIQKPSFPEGQPGHSLYPREIIQAEVPPGLYYVRVKVRSQNFESHRDELRIVTSGDFTRQIDVTTDDTVLAPADNDTVITVGASDDLKSSRSPLKPDLWFPSLVRLTNGELYKGSSNSSAAAVAAAVVVRSLRPEYSRDQILSALTFSGGDIRGSVGGGRGFPLEILQFGPTGPGGCFATALLPYIPPAAQGLVRDGAVSVHSSHGIKIFTPSDPIQYAPHLRRMRPDDMVVVGPHGFELWPRHAQWQLGTNTYEVVQQPQGQTICGFSGSGPVSQSEEHGPVSTQTLRLPSPSHL